MKCIYRKISLEQFKCRIPNTLTAFHDGNYVLPLDENFFIDNPNGNYGTCPSDIILPDGIFSGISRTYDLSNITDVLSTSINIMSSASTPIFLEDESSETYYYDMTEIGKTTILDGIKYCKLTTHDGYKITTDESDTPHRYMSYRKLHKWYKFFQNYFKLLRTTTCQDSEKVYQSAQDYYYSENEKFSGETLNYFEELDNLFIARGGVIDSGGAHCDLYEWMRDYIFLEYDMNEDKGNSGRTSVKQYAKEWKNTRFNIVSLIRWFSWFGYRYSLYSGVTDCSLMDYDDLEETDCCDCQEYFTLGGNDMYFFLQECVQDYQEKMAIMQGYCTNTATINLQIPISVSNNNMGEQSVLSENWEGGVDYSPISGEPFGTTVRYGGSSFHREDNNEIITVQDSIFVSDSRVDYPEGYYYNKYKELGFIKNGKSLYQEYLPHYITEHQEEFDIKDNYDENNHPYTAYAYSDYDFVRNPYSGNMCTNYDIVTPSGNTHFFYINDTILETEFHEPLLNIDGEVVSGSVNPIFIQYTKSSGTSLPYVEYKDKRFFGYWFNNIKNYRFTFKKIPKHDTDWYDRGDFTEYLLYNNVYYPVIDNKVTIDINNNGRGYEDAWTYTAFDGYIKGGTTEIEESYILISNNHTAISIYDEDTNTFNWVATSATSFSQAIDLIDKPEDDGYLRCYWVENNVLHFLKPYTKYKFGSVEGKVRSRLIELKDYSLSYDKLGNTLSGLYCGTNPIPTDNEILDFYYHINNGSSLSYIVSEEDTSKYVYSGDTTLKSQKVDYYWGNIISGIRFYFKDENDDIIKNSIVEIPRVYTDADELDENVVSNIKYVKDCLFKYIKDYSLYSTSEELIKDIKDAHIDDLICVGKDSDDYRIFKVTDVIFPEELSGSTIGSYNELKNLNDQIDNLQASMYCEIQYNIGGIIQRPWTLDSEGLYKYGMYQLTDDYHQGVEYKEEFTLTTDTEKYYDGTDTFFNVNYLKLNPTEVVTYTLDTNPDDDSDVYSANTAYFNMETSYDFYRDLEDGQKKYTTSINTSLSDGRQFNYYNGLMASPTFVENYNIGIASLRNVSDDIYVNRGVSYAFDKHLKLLEIKSLEALENYGNGFYNIIDNNIEK